MYLQKTKSKKKKFKYTSKPKWGTCERCHRENIWVSPHHIYGGPYRQKSEIYKAYIYVCDWCHTLGPNAIERTSLVNELKVEWQPIIMYQEGWTIKQWIGVFGKNYL